jgi:CheY-like chemotaxis protein
MKPKKILLVDDQNTVLMMERLVLQGAGYETVLARNGIEAIQKALLEHPDLIIMDIVMPEMDGIAACRTLRAREETKTVPIIMCTTRGESTSMQAGYDAGCSDYITKPFKGVELVTKVQEYLGK